MKKLIITLIVLGILVVGTIVGVKIYKDHRKNSNPVKCMPVSMLNQGYWDPSDENSSGYISATTDQKIYADMNSVIEEVYVSEGDTVKAGDAILKFDMTQKELEVETMRTQLEVYKTDVSLAERQLEKLKNIVPKILSGVESIVIIVFSILLLIEPGHHHAMIHLYLLMAELVIAPLTPLLDELLTKIK